MHIDVTLTGVIYLVGYGIAVYIHFPAQPAAFGLMHAYISGKSLLHMLYMLCNAPLP